MNAMERTAPTLVVVDRRLCRAMVFGSIIATFSCIAVLMSFKYSRRLPLEWFWLVLGIAANVVLIRRLAKMNSTGSRFLFGHTTFCILRDGRIEHEIRYDSVTGYRLDNECGSEWLMIERAGAQPIVVSHYPFFRTRRLEAEELIRNLGPRLSRSASQERGERPEEPLSAHIWDHFGSPPAMPIQVGERYRYIAPNDVYDHAMRGTTHNMVFWVVGAQLIYMLLTAFSMKGSWILMVLAFGALLYGLSREGRWTRFFSQASKDVIEPVPEGLRITRKGRSFLVYGPCEWIQDRRLTQPTLRYQDGQQSYLLVPGFLELDR